MQLTISQFIREQCNPVPLVVHVDLQGKTVIVTGANNGIGFEAAKHFACMNPGKLILACRSKERGEVALTKLREETGCKTAELWILDLAQFSSVKSFAERFNSEGGRLDILVENAAILPPNKYEPTTDGWEPTFQVNNLSTSLLALLLLPRLVETSQQHQTTSRLVVVSSDAHYRFKIDQEVVDAPNPLRLFGSSAEYIAKTLKSRYGDSKLLNIFFARALSERLQNRPVIVNTVNPGYCYSGIRAGFTGPRAWFDWLLEKALARTSEAGSRQLIWAAVGGEDQKDDLRGAYISQVQVSEASDYVISDEGKAVQDKLWNNLVDELTKVDPRVQQVVEDCIERPINN
ncbi:NAD(P)-binding protein [Flammula alnicola]|nr:NAD(P)-binding protein [Flammula alnicola]